MVGKVRKRINGWGSKLLSKAGKRVLLLSLLSCMNIYTFLAYLVPKTIIKHLESCFLSFSWGTHLGRSKKKWKAWTSLAKPIKEGGLGFKSLSLIMKAFRMKCVWNILTKDSLYANFIWDRYVNDLNIRDLPLILIL